jgi:chaperonin GroES
MAESISKFNAVGEHVIVKRHKKKLETSGGIVLQDGFTEETFRARVVAVGSGRRSKTGALIPFDVKVGDEIVLGRHAWQRNNVIKIEGDDNEYCSINEEKDVLAVIDNEDDKNAND